MSSGRNVMLLFYFIIMWAMFMSGLFKSGAQAGLFLKARVFMTIRNDLTTNLMLGYHLSEFNLSAHTLQPNKTFNFNIRSNLSGSINFVCYF
jgi:hypothetical protein